MAAWRRLPGLRDPDRFEAMAPSPARQRVLSRSAPEPAGGGASKSTSIRWSMPDASDAT